jgi:ATP-dependent helicase YprA (DUF1998 family)
MNALATDQARRIADLIHTIPATLASLGPDGISP